jgi:hypothetical protein
MTLAAKFEEITFFDNNKDYLHPLIKQWQEINLEYINLDPNRETYYWFNERANTSALAGAIWKEGGMAVEESSIKRVPKSNVGRADLHFHYKQKQVLCEVKHNWLLIPQATVKNFNAEIIKTHLEAIEDTAKTQNGRDADHYLALTFITPYWTATSEHDCPTESFTRLRKQLIQQLQDKLEVKIKTKPHLKSQLSFVAYQQMAEDFYIEKTAYKEKYNSIILIGSEVFKQ